MSSDTGAGPSQATRRRRLRTAAWLLAASALSGVVTARAAIDPEYWWHRAIGRLIRSTGLPATEPFSFLPTAGAWVGQSWAYEWLLARLDFGVMLIIMGLAATAAMVVAARSAPRAVPVSRPLTAAAIVLSALVSAPDTGVRSQVVTLLGTAIVLWITARWRDGSGGWVWVLPPLVLVWANLDGGFVLGIALPLMIAVATLVIRAVGTDRSSAPIRPLVLAAAAATAGALINPAGPELYPFVLRSLTAPTLGTGLASWQSPDFHTWAARLFELEVIILVVLWMADRRPDPLHVVLGLGAAAAGLAGQSCIPVFAIVAAPQIVQYGTALLRTHLPRLHPAPVAVVATASLAVTVGALLLTVARDHGAFQRIEASEYPAAAAGYVSVHDPGQRVFTRYQWGGYLAGRIPVGRVVFLYGYPAVFGSRGLQRYDDVSQIRSAWRSELRTDRVRVAIVPRVSQEASALTEVGWAVAFTDHDADALVLQAPGSGSAR